MDNRWIVPYNPFLLLCYNCHINVEITSPLTAVKYPYKYVYKGHDMAAIAVATMVRDGEPGGNQPLAEDLKNK